MTEQGIYVYAVARDLPRDATGHMHGIGGAPVRIVEEDGLMALVGDVDLGEFGEDPLRHNLEDLAWLEATARAHHGVVDAAVALAAALPLGLATVYRGEGRVREMLRKRGGWFRTALDRITGRTEWGVKGYAAPVRRAASGTTGGDATDRPGTSYLLRRREERSVEEDARRAVIDFADRVDAELRGIAVAARLHPPQDAQLSGREEWMILNAAYLVDDTRAEDFRAAVVRLSGVRTDVWLHLTGPWAAYSFAGEEETWTES